MTTTSYNVSGMTCDHCARSVTEELTEIPGVTGVQVDVAAGTATVTSSAPLDVASVRKAVEEAGYQLI